MSSQTTTTSSTRAARLQVGFLSVLCFIGLGAAVRPYGGFSSGDTVKVPGVGSRTPVELALLALRFASAVFALWLLVAIVASVVNLVRARSSAGTKSVAASRSTPRNKNYQATKSVPRLFGPGWLQQLLRQAAGGTLALALLAGPASAVTRSPQAGTARTVLAPVASVFAGDNTGIQFAGDVTTGQRWPVLPEVSKTATPLTAGDSSLVSSPNTDTSSVRKPSQATTVTPTTATPRSAAATPARTSAPTPTPRVVPTTTGSTTQPTTTTGPQSSSGGAATAAMGAAVSATSSPAVGRSGLPVERINLEAINRSETVNQPANAEQPARQSPETSTLGLATSSSQQAAVHVVAPGESFWAIAEQHVLAHDPKADDHAIARYWEALQAQNAHRLPAPGVPDLLFPGTELSLPPIMG